MAVENLKNFKLELSSDVPNYDLDALKAGIERASKGEDFVQLQWELAKASVETSNNEAGNLDKEDGHDCKLCKNRGYSFILEDYSGRPSETYIPCECMKVRSMIKKIRRSGLRNIMMDYTFDKYTTEDGWQKMVKEKALKFLEDGESDWFFIGGQSGCGKTHICTAITAEYLKKNIAAQYMLWKDESTRIKSLVTDAEQYNAAVYELKTVPVLYIDDLFKTGKDNYGAVKRPTAADISLAYEIINYRYINKGLVTIVSSEYMLSDLFEIDEALGGRIAEKTVQNGYGFSFKKDMSKNFRAKGIIEV